MKRAVYLLFLTALLSFSCSPATVKTPAHEETVPERAPRTEAELVPAMPSGKHAGAPHGVPAGDAYYYYMMGYSEELEGNMERALANYRQVLALDPDSPFVRRELGSLLLRMGRPDEAEREILAALEADPEYIPAFMLLAQIYTQRRDFTRAGDAYQSIILIDPGNRPAYVHLGMLYVSQKRYDEAGDVFRDLYERDKGDIISLYYMGVVQMSLENLEEAAGIFRQVLELRPDFELAVMNLGTIYERLGQQEEAARYFEMASRLNPGNVAAKEKLINMLLGLRQTEEAIVQLEEAKEMVPPNPEISRKLGILYMETNRYEKAVPELQTVLEAEPGDTNLRYYLALTLEALERYDEAIGELEAVIREEPEHLNSYLHLGYIYTDLDQFEEAVRVYERVLSFEKDNPDVYNYLGRTYSLMEEDAKAEQVYRDALMRFDTDDELHFSLAVIYEKTDRQEEMIVHLKRSIELNPDSRVYLRRAGDEPGPGRGAGEARPRTQAGQRLHHRQSGMGLLPEGALSRGHHPARAGGLPGEGRPRYSRPPGRRLLRGKLQGKGPGSVEAGTAAPETGVWPQGADRGEDQKAHRRTEPLIHACAGGSRQDQLVSSRPRQG
jgi:tetratricopeptide (TPR) repeat protein